MIVDCFPFLNELELLEIRLNVLDPYVDKFVLVEAAKTQTLKKKPFVFEENKSKFEKFLDKIEHVKLDEYDCPIGGFRNVNNDWTMEHLQRNSVCVGVDRLDLSMDDIILISDLDEIPNLTQVEENIKFVEDKVMTSFVNNTYSYFLNMKCYDGDRKEEKISRHSLGVLRKTLKVHSPQELWSVRNTAPRPDTPRGWHLSWLGGPQKVREKSLSCIEPFDKSCVPSEEKMEEVFNKRVMVDGYWNINNPSDNSVSVGKVDSSCLPDYLIENKEKYKHLFC